jgi:hypothetical protein
MRPIVALFVAGSIAAGVWAWRHHGRPGTRVTVTATPPAEEALRWLARHQSADGHWSATRFSKQCSGGKCMGADPTGDAVVVTSYALLAFLGRGYTPQNRSSYVDAHSGKTVHLGNAVRDGLSFLLDHEETWRAHGPDDPFLDRAALATLAVSEAFGITDAALYRAATARTVAAIESSRLPGGVFAGDFGVTLHAAMALKSAEISGIALSRGTVAALASWSRGAPSSTSRHPTELAARLLVRVFFTRAKPSEAELAPPLADPPRWEDAAFEHWYLATLAIFQASAPYGDAWKQWDPAVVTLLEVHQAQASDECTEGSWLGSRGRVLDTALGSLVLAARPSHVSVFGSGKK